jgi:hypothetical protein
MENALVSDGPSVALKPEEPLQTPVSLGGADIFMAREFRNLDDSFMQSDIVNTREIENDFEGLCG